MWRQNSGTVPGAGGVTHVRVQHPDGGRSLVGLGRVYEIVGAAASVRPEERTSFVVDLVEEIAGQVFRAADAEGDAERPAPVGFRDGGWLSSKRGPAGTTLDRRVIRALEYVERNVGCQSLTIGAAAQAVGLSRWHLARLLRRETGEGFVAHLRDARMRIATALLAREESVSVKDVAWRVGFCSIRAFDREFKRTVGLTPSAYRRRSLRDQEAPTQLGLFD